MNGHTGAQLRDLIAAVFYAFRETLPGRESVKHQFCGGAGLPPAPPHRRNPKDAVEQVFLTQAALVVAV